MIVDDNSRKLDEEAMIKEVLEELAKERPLFHSEADFQHSLAWKIHEKKGNLKIKDIRLERNAFEKEGKNNYVDIILTTVDNKYIPIELKYKTKKGRFESNNETYNLKNQGAMDFGCYDFIKDIERIETFKQKHKEGYATGFSIFLTNDLAYTRDTGRDSCYRDFKINEGRTIKKKQSLNWAKEEKQWQKGRPSINLDSNYKFEWNLYSKKDGTQGYKFKYLIVKTAK